MIWHSTVRAYFTKSFLLVTQVLPTHFEEEIFGQCQGVPFCQLPRPPNCISTLKGVMFKSQAPHQLSSSLPGPAAGSTWSGPGSVSGAFPAEKPHVSTYQRPKLDGLEWQSSETPARHLLYAPESGCLSTCVLKCSRRQVPGSGCFPNSERSQDKELTDSPALPKMMVNRRNIQRRCGVGAPGGINIGYDGNREGGLLDPSGT